jgi:hypothetical protein
MTAFGTTKVNYAQTIDAARVARRSFTSAVNLLPEYNGTARQQGTMSIPITTAASLAANTDGAMFTNAAAQTLVTMTFTSGNYTASIAPEALYQFDQTDIVASHYRAALYAQILAVETAMLTATTTGYMAATPGSSGTLAAGQQNFTCATGTDGQKFAALNKLDAGIAYVAGQTGNDYENMFIILPVNSWTNLRTIVNTSAGYGLALGTDGWMSYTGIPIYASRASTTGWGGTSAGHTAGIVAHRDSGAAAFGEPIVWGEPGRESDDGFYKWTWMCPYGVKGGVQGLWYEILNSSC